MQFQVECFENMAAFGVASPPLWDKPEQFENAPLRRVENLRVEAETSMAAADEAFHIANAPWNPTDLDGVAWDHTRVRSMSSGDVVVVHTPDGPVAYGCLFMGWVALPPSMMPAGVTV